MVDQADARTGEMSLRKLAAMSLIPMLLVLLAAYGCGQDATPAPVATVVPAAFVLQASTPTAIPTLTSTPVPTATPTAIPQLPLLPTSTPTATPAPSFAQLLPDLFSGGPGGGAASGGDEDAASVEDVLKQGLRLAEASPVHIALRGTAADDSVRCDWRGIARTPEQREAAIRFWLDLDDTDPLPSPDEVERRFMAKLDRINAVYPATVKSNFRSLARGGLTTGYSFLTCYADYTVQEYVLGSGPTGTSDKLTVTYDRMRESRSYELYKLAHAGGEFGSESLMTEAEYAEWRSQLVSDVELVLSIILEGRESIVFLAPMGAHNAIAVEAWQVVAQWDLQTDDQGTVNAVRFGAPQHDPEHTQTLANLKNRITTATTATSTATTTPERIANVSGLTQYYRDIGAYGDITPDDGSIETFTPTQPPPVPTCLGVNAVSDPRLNPGLVRDCSILLASMDTLAGTATLDWNATSTISTWEGIGLNASSTRVTVLDLDDEDLDGTIPPAFGGLSALETLDISDNDLAGEIPEELGRLWSLQTLRLSGNSFTGCIPVALEDVPTNDLASLNLLYCHPPAPQNLSAGTPGETSVALSWDAVSNTSGYRVEYLSATSTDWTVDIDNATSTTHTVDGLSCGSDYRFRVSAYGSGTTYAAAWSNPSDLLYLTTARCNEAPEFASSSYTFSVAENASTGTLVGAISATDPDDGDPVTYTIIAGADAGKFDIRRNTGAIVVAGDLDHETSPSHTLTVGATDSRGGTGTATVEIEVTNVIELPGVPQNLRGTVVGASVTLEWDAPDDPTVTGYQVLRRQPAIHATGVFDVLVEDTGSADTVYVDTNVEPRTQYVYRVKAVNTDGESNRSRFASVTTGAASAPAPQDLGVSLSEDMFTVTWNEVSGAASYEVEYRTDPGDDWMTVSTTTAVTVMYSPEDGPACGTTYEFRVRSRGDGTTYAAALGGTSEPESVTTDRCNDPPEFTSSTYTFLVLEGSAAGAVVGTVTATDADLDTVTYTITSGNGDGGFAMATSTGVITLSSALGDAVGHDVHSERGGERRLRRQRERRCDGDGGCAHVLRRDCGGRPRRQPWPGGRLRDAAGSEGFSGWYRYAELERRYDDHRLGRCDRGRDPEAGDVPEPSGPWTEWRDTS